MAQFTRSALAYVCPLLNAFHMYMLQSSSAFTNRYQIVRFVTYSTRRRCIEYCLNRTGLPPLWHHPMNAKTDAQPKYKCHTRRTRNKCIGPDCIEKRCPKVNAITDSKCSPHIFAQEPTGNIGKHTQ